MALYYAGMGAPTNGTSGTLVGVASKGDFYRDDQTNFLYQNTTDKTSPTWALVSGRDDSGNLTLASKLVGTPKAAQTVTAGTTIANDAFVKQISSGSALTITAHPAIATSGVAAGTMMLILNTNASNAITVSDDGTDSGSKVKLRTGTTLALTPGLPTLWVFDGTNWLEVV